MTLKVLIIGGYGTFGGNIARLLADRDEVELIIAGRSHAKAEEFCKTVSGRASIKPAAFDRNGDFQTQLASFQPDIVVDASGPFQAYGDDPYRVVRAALALGVDYLDLADGSDFVSGIAIFDSEAKAKNIVLLSGVSSFPVLSTAVVRRLAADMAQVETITAGLAPSPHSGLGSSVIAAIASYAGKPVRLWRDGHEVTALGLVETKRFHIRPPGLTPLSRSHFSLVDVPDLRLIPPLWPGLQSTWIGVGTSPALLHRLLNLLARLVKWRIVPSLTPLAGLIHWTTEQIRIGERRSGMVVQVEGRDASGERRRKSWHVITEGNDGQMIPSMPVAALIRQRLESLRRPAGARAALQELELADFDPFFAERSIRYRFRDDGALSPEMPLYQRVLADAWFELPLPIRQMHETSTALASGAAEVTRGGSLLSRLVARIFGFPKADADIPVSVRFSRQEGRETWTRRFGGKTFSSEQYEGQGSNAGLVCERFGPFVFAMALVLDQDRLRLVVRRWSAFGIPMPAFLAPTGEAFERVEHGCFHFHVEIRLPLAGLIVRYRGWLAVEQDSPATPPP